MENPSAYHKRRSMQPGHIGKEVIPDKHGHMKKDGHREDGKNEESRQDRHKTE